MSSKYHCDFCGKSEDEVRKLISLDMERRNAPAICDSCIGVCNDVLSEQPDVVKRAMMELL